MKSKKMLRFLLTLSVGLWGNSQVFGVKVRNDRGKCCDGETNDKNSKVVHNTSNDKRSKAVNTEKTRSEGCSGNQDASGTLCTTRNEVKKNSLHVGVGQGIRQKIRQTISEAQRILRKKNSGGFDLWQAWILAIYISCFFSFLVTFCNTKLGELVHDMTCGFVHAKCANTKIPICPSLKPIQDLHNPGTCTCECGKWCGACWKVTLAICKRCKFYFCREKVKDAKPNSDSEGTPDKDLYQNLPDNCGVCCCECCCTVEGADNSNHETGSRTSDYRVSRMAWILFVSNILWLSTFWYYQLGGLNATSKTIFFFDLISDKSGSDDFIIQATNYFVFVWAAFALYVFDKAFYHEDKVTLPSNPGITTATPQASAPPGDSYLRWVCNFVFKPCCLGYPVIVKYNGPESENHSNTPQANVRPEKYKTDQMFWDVQFTVTPEARQKKDSSAPLHEASENGEKGVRRCCQTCLASLRACGHGCCTLGSEFHSAYGKHVWPMENTTTNSSGPCELIIRMRRKLSSFCCELVVGTALCFNYCFCRMMFDWIGKCDYLCCCGCKTGFDRPYEPQQGQEDNVIKTDKKAVEEAAKKTQWFRFTLYFIFNVCCCGRKSGEEGVIKESNACCYVNLLSCCVPFNCCGGNVATSNRCIPPQTQDIQWGNATYTSGILAAPYWIFLFAAASNRIWHCIKVCICNCYFFRQCWHCFCAFLHFLGLF